MHRSLFYLGILSQAFLAPATDNGGGTPEPKAEEPKTLPQAKARITELDGQLATETQRANTEQARAEKAEAEVTRLTEQFNSATQAAQDAQAQLATANASIATITGERDTARADLTTATANVTRLEALCGVRGIDPKAAVPAEAGAQTSDSDEGKYRAWQKATGAEKTKLFRENKDAIERFANAHPNEEAKA